MHYFSVRWKKMVVAKKGLQDFGVTIKFDYIAHQNYTI